MLNRILWLPVAVGLLAAVGCSKPSVSGQVTVAGQPIAAGHIQFVAQGRTGSSASSSEGDSGTFSAPIKDGKFLVTQNQIEGTYKVIVDVHFVEAHSAADFYSGTSTSSPGEVKTQEFIEQLTNGRNTLSYDLTAD